METMKYAVGQGIRQWRIALVVYIIQLLIAMTLGMQLYQVFEASIGSSLELDKLLQSYDHTIVQDFLNVHGGSITPIIGQVRWVILAYMIFSIFINAGLLYVVREKSTSWKDFWNGGATYFFKAAGLFFLYLICYAILLAIIGIGFGSVFGKLLDFSSEKVGFLWMGILGLVFVISMLKIMSASVYSRFAIREGQSVWQAFKSGWRSFRKKWRPTLGIIALMLLIQLAIYFIYLYIEGIWGMTSAATVVIFFLIQQAIIFFRSVWKLMVYNGLERVYQK